MNREEQAIARLFTGKLPGTVIELCPGFGNLAAHLSNLGHTVIAADIAPTTAYSRGITALAANMNCRLPFKDASADYAVCSGAIEHFEFQYAFARELARVLKPGGRCYLSTPNIVNLASRLRFLLTGFYALAERPCPETGEKNFYFEHIYPITYYQLRHMLHTTGLRISRVAADRLRRSCFFLLWLYPFAWLFTRLALMREPLPEQNRANRRIGDHLLSLTLLAGRNLIIEAVKAPADENKTY